MKPAIPALLFIVSLIFIACENQQEEVLPTRPISDTTTVAARQETPPVETTPKKTPAVVVNSEFYQYGKFGDMPYRVLFPRNYDPNKRYPLLIFLHGISERGTDNEKQLVWGSKLFQADSIRKKYPAVIIFPQCPENHYWSDIAPSETLKSLVDSVATTYAIDKSKINIGGLSMGAYGTYALVARYPGFFSSAIAISGDGDESKASLMSTTAWRIFGGAKDKIVPASTSEKMAKALQASGAKVSLKVYPDADHPGSWMNAFKEPDFCSWIFK